MYHFTTWISFVLVLSVTAYRPPPELVDGAIHRYSALSNELGFHLQRAQSYQPGNQLISPYGVSTVLSALYEGSRGITKEQLGRIGYLSLEQKDIDISKINQQLRQFLQRSSGEIQLREVMALLYPSGYSVSTQYQQLLESYYICLVQQGTDDFHVQVNHWLEEQTDGKISHIVKDVDAISGITFLNGIYFEGVLKSQRIPEQTRQQPFYNENEDSVTTVLSYQTQSRYHYYQDQQLQAVEIPYQGEEYSLLVLLPREQKEVRQLQQQISYRTLQRVIRESRKTEIRVSIPQFTLDYSSKLNEYIRSIGIRSIFGSEADFFGVRSSEGPYVEKIAQRAVLKVGKYGGERVYKYEIREEDQHIDQQGHEYETEQGRTHRDSLPYIYQGYRYGNEQEDQYHKEQQHRYSSQGQRYGGRQQYKHEFGDRYEGQQQHQRDNFKRDDEYGSYSYGQGETGVVEFQADRPFLFYVIHKPTGLNLFAGRISQL